MRVGGWHLWNSDDFVRFLLVRTVAPDPHPDRGEAGDHRLGRIERNDLVVRRMSQPGGLGQEREEAEMVTIIGL